MKLGNLREIQVEARVEIGRARLNLAELASAGEGTIIALDKLAGEPVDLVVAGERIARGEVVVIDELFGIRLTEMVAREE